VADTGAMNLVAAGVELNQRKYVKVDEYLRDKPCAPMHVPPALLSLVERVTMADYGSGF
jgi:hypothetical protein